jgi:hypothetical protein
MSSSAELPPEIANRPNQTTDARVGEKISVADSKPAAPVGSVSLGVKPLAARQGGRGAAVAVAIVLAILGLSA